MHEKLRKSEKQISRFVTIHLLSQKKEIMIIA